MEKIRYSEIFYSVQGEGRFVGVPSVFFRTFGSTSIVMGLDRAGTDQNGSNQRTCLTTHRTSQN